MSSSRKDLLAWFEEVWNDDSLTKDVKEEVLRHLERLYANHAPEFIYYLTLFHIFREDLNALCDTFDDRTRNGTDMARENQLLARAVESIKTTFGKRAAAALFSGRDGLLPTQSDTPNSSADLELVTWLVLI